MRSLPLWAAALLAALSGCATESYVLRTPGLRPEDSSRLTDALKRFDGVADVRLPGTLEMAVVTTRDRKPLPELAVVSSLHGLGIEVSSFEHPGWARIPVYVVSASGGG